MVALDPFAVGRPPAAERRTSEDWSEIQLWSDRMYMPYVVRPLGVGLSPRSSMYSTKIGDITVTRFSYGIPVSVGDFSSDAGNALVLTTIRGNARHHLDHDATANTPSGDTFVADCSRVDYLVEFSPDHVQLNLTVPHTLLADTAVRWWGFDPGDVLWQRKCVIGGGGSGWQALLGYAMRTTGELPGHATEGRIGLNLQELLVGHLLTEWAARAGVDPDRSTGPAAPGYVRHAVQYIREYARELPTSSDIADAVGVSVRTLSGSFRKYLDTTPAEYVREQRLQGIREELLTASPGATVASIAGAWGYVNLGLFAAAYRRRFGENPSQTRAFGPVSG
ncbi:AraC family transcriptional regulator [Rhodococcus sp. JS3073]|uniref:AraC family transcriptional regulator n=1 Tax=Rhodococcus sp. JS3073 TaxID=3002901 RepID=UPI002285DC3E|nr:helix-turn-helix transcriptional regulator [Rhodococcus sp. JS3073]WAM17308.1 helix-turn-helix transcriptional regulator [Rhodococcus sp. JS3073]